MSASSVERTVIKGSCDGEPIRIPRVDITGSGDGPTLAIVAGVHGSEYPGIEAAIRLSRQMERETFRGRLRIVPIHNAPAFYGRAEAVCPIDGKNPNRVFPGDPGGTYTDVMNYLVFSSVVEGADGLINVHGGDIFEALVPYCGLGEGGSPDVDERSRSLGLVYGAPFLVRFASRPSTSYGKDLTSAAVSAGVPAILAEAGGNGLLDEANTMVHLRGFINTMKHLGMLDGEVDLPEPVRETQSTFWRVDRECLFYPSVSLGQKVRKGEVIGELRDWFGSAIEPIRAPHDAHIIAIVTTPAAKKDAIVYQVAF